VKLCQELLPAPNGQSLKKQKVEEDEFVAQKTSSQASVRSLPVLSVFSSPTSSSAPVEPILVPEPGTFAPADHEYDVDIPRALPANVKPVPSLQELGLARSSFAFGVASNDFSCLVFDAGIVSAGSNRGVGEAEFATVGKALLLNSRLRRLLVPFCLFSEKDFGLLFGPCIEYGHSLGLTVLDLRGNNLGKSAAPDIVSLVTLCPNLQILLLDGNNLNEAGLLSIIK
jgi:hypothetical protein